MTTTGVQGVQGARLRSESGEVLPLPGDRWLDGIHDADRSVLEHATPPVLDLGCGPGRHVQALAEAGCIVMGVDLSAHAVDLARSKGLCVLERSVFESIPKAGEWGSALLLDGNIGIGGDPVALLAHVTSLLEPSGRVLIEVDAEPVANPHTRVRLELGDEAGPWFDWAVVDRYSVVDVAQAAGLTLCRQWEIENRHFAWLETFPS